MAATRHFAYATGPESVSRAAQNATREMSQLTGLPLDLMVGTVAICCHIDHHIANST
jgi:hypothetical protein